MIARNPIVDAKPDQIAPAQLAVEGEVEQREFAASMAQLQPNPDGPGLLQRQWGLPSEQFALVSRHCTRFGLDLGIHESLLRQVKEASS